MTQIKYTAEVDGTEEFTISREQLDMLDIVNGPDGSFHILHEGKGYILHVEKSDFDKKEFILRLDHRPISVHLRSRTEERVHKMGLEEVVQSHVDKIIAPMPGLVLDVMVGAGDEIAKGDTLVILEAMKMENVISAPNDGKVKEVLAVKGNSIEKAEVLIVLE